MGRRPGLCRLGGEESPYRTQWEKAARGTDKRWWPWGNDFYPGFCNWSELGINRTTDVTRFHQGVSPYGCYDMSGNVWEMCEGAWIEGHLPMRGGASSAAPLLCAQRSAGPRRTKPTGPTGWAFGA